MSASPARLRLAVAALLLAGCASARAQESLEYTVKAAYLTKFAPFVQWPVEPAIGRPLALCVAGSDPFGTVLDKAIMGQAGRPIVVKRMAVLAPDSGCHVAFVGSGASAAQSLAAVRGAAILTVSENAADDSARGIVNFIVRAGRVRFEIDRPTADQNHLVISSKLLTLAVPRPG